MCYPLKTPGPCCTSVFILNLGTNPEVKGTGGLAVPLLLGAQSPLRLVPCLLVSAAFAWPGRGPRRVDDSREGGSPLSE